MDILAGMQEKTDSGPSFVLMRDGSCTCCREIESALDLLSKPSFI